jgi:hypothetical protein|tara:strand:- start:162 stop:710 length:549 start_codon:yes stop_codon:yes gene_type:complete
MKNDNNLLKLDLLNTQPIPGESFTQEPGLRPYEKPAKITRPDDALGFMLQMLSSPKIEEDMFELLDVGISVETIVSAFVLNAFTEGVFSPDVAELIKQPLIQIITSRASEQGIEDIKVLNTDTPKNMDVEDKFEMMKSLNPSKFNRLMSPDDDDDDGMDVDEDMLEEEDVESEGFIERRNEI